MSWSQPKCSPATPGRRPPVTPIATSWIHKGLRIRTYRHIQTQADRTEPSRSYTQHANGGLRWRPPLQESNGVGERLSFHCLEQPLPSKLGSQPGLRRLQKLRGPQPNGGLGWWGDSAANSTNSSAAPVSKGGPTRADSGKSALPFEATYAGGGGSTDHLARPSQAGAVLQGMISALNVLSTGETTAEDHELWSHFEPHEDINVEHQSTIASSVGRAFYEVLRVDQAGKTHKMYIKRRDLLRRNRLLPRDLRRIDPSLSVIKTSPSITVKDHALLVNIGGVRMILSADKALLFEPNSSSCRKWQDLVLPRLATSDSERAVRAHRAKSGSTIDTNDDGDQEFDVADHPPPPFELELLEAALMVATGRLDDDLMTVTKRVQTVLRALPKDVTPVNLEELRRVKQLLVELESKADMLRNMLEELMDDQEDIGDINLSSRPKREEFRRQRDRDALERELERGILASLENNSGNGGTFSYGSSPDTLPPQPKRRSKDDGEEEGNRDSNAEDALARLVEREEAEREAEEVEDLLEYYMQRAATLQSESERLLAGARDLEESIGVSLSARRFEVQRLELTLSIGSFAAALGAVVAGVFGMNLRSTFEESVIGFWGVTALILVGCIGVFWAVYRYMQYKRIL